MLHFQIGTFKGRTDDGLLIVETQEPPVLIKEKSETTDDQESSTLVPKTVSEEKKRKHYHLDTDGSLILPDKKTNGVVYKMDGTVETINGPFDAKTIRKVIGCSTFQMVPCTVASLKNKFELWINEEGAFENELNENASNILGEQVFGGKLYGNVLILQRGAVN